MSEKKEPAEAGGTEVARSGGVPPKVDPTKRVVAYFIDAVPAAFAASILGMIGAFIPVIGGFLGLAGAAGAAGYMLVRDSLNDGRSFGKKLQGLTVATPQGGPCTREQSIRRNLIQALPFLAWTVNSMFAAVFGLIPVLGGLIGGLLSILFLPVVLLCGLASAYEAVQVLALDPNGRRLLELKEECYTVEG